MRSAPQPEPDLPDGLPVWLATFVREALRETETLFENGANQAATARGALTQRLLAAAHTRLDSEIGVNEAANSMGVCEETIRRAVRDGDLPDRRPHSKGRHRIRRGDIEKLATHIGRPYDANADAQDIARLRRAFP